MAASSVCEENVLIDILAIGDVLPALTLETHRTLFFGSELTVKDLHSARLACRALHDAIDGSVQAVSLPDDLELPEVAALTAGGTWLQRWPRLRKVTLPWVDGRVCVPFASAAPAACLRITELVLGKGDRIPLDAIPSTALHSVLSRLPRVQSLSLLCAGAWSANVVMEQQLAAHAFSLLASLTSLELCDNVHLTCLPASTRAQLTRLVLGSTPGSFGRLDIVDIPGHVCSLATLKELQLSVYHEYQPGALARLLGVLPPSLKELALQWWGQGLVAAVAGVAGCSLTGSLAEGCLASVRIVCGEGYQPYRQLSAFLAMDLLQCRALGPRLGCLTLCGVDAAGGAPDPDPAAALLRRCDKVTLQELRAGKTVEETLAVVRALGLPEVVRWDGGLAVCLRVPRTATANCERGGNGGGGWQAPLPPVLLLEAVVARALRRMAACPPGSDGGSLLVLSGPLVRSVAAHPIALRAGMQRLSDELGPRRLLGSFQALPSAGVVVLAGLSAGAEEAVAEAVRRLAGRGGGGSGDGAGGSTVEGTAAPLDIRPSGLEFSQAVGQVLQALWDGEQEAAAEEAVAGEEGGHEAQGGSGSDAGATATGGGGATKEPPPGTGDALDRLQCLLETGQGLQSLPPAEDLPYVPPAPPPAALHAVGGLLAAMAGLLGGALEGGGGGGPAGGGAGPDGDEVGD